MFNSFEKSIITEIEKINTKLTFKKIKLRLNEKLWFEIDIFIPEKNIYIECQGPRHYIKPSMRRMCIDQIKRHYLKQNNLLYFEIFGNKSIQLQVNNIKQYFL